MSGEEMVRIIETLAYNLYKGCLIGNPPPYVEQVSKDIRNPKPGDLVLEISTLFSRRIRSGREMEPRGVSGIGRLLRITEEPHCTLEQWMEGGEEESEPIPTERVWYIALEFGDGSEMRWTNAMFIKIPEEIYK